MKRFVIFSSIVAALVATKAQTSVKYVIETDKPEQTIMHFGASDAWSMDKLGLWPDKQQKQIADWLFSMDTYKDGRPKGIGLSLWRFNLGAGSAEQGDDSQINEPTRTECLMNSDGTWNWNKQKGQRNFLKLAKQRGVPYFLAFLNSVPVYYTENRLATNTGRGGTINLRKDAYGKVAQFAAKAIKGIESHDGIHFDFFSPVNEADGSWNWIGPKQEGSPATNREITKLTKTLDREFQNNGITTRITLNECSDYRALISNHNTDWQRGKSLDVFFCKDSADTYVGNLKNVPRLILAHSYWTNTPVSFMKQIRKQLRDSLEKRKIHFWQSEICIMSNDVEIGGGRDYDYSMKTALYVARVIHHDLVYANAESWSWWRAAGGNYRDGLLRIYGDSMWKSGWACDSKLLWVMGNFSRFVRPGAVRHDVSAINRDGTAVADGETDPEGVMCSAYRNKNGKWAVVAINYSQDVKKFGFAFSNDRKTKWRIYRTSNISDENISPCGETYGNTALPPRSVTTFVSVKQQ